MPTITNAGITYSKPTVTLLQDTGIGTAELAARTCYNSFDASEHHSIQHFNENLAEVHALDLEANPLAHSAASVRVNSAMGIDHSELLDDLAWTHFHHSILEHANLTYLVRGISRGALQEHARHRIQAISVQSTRYTMSSIINAFVASTAIVVGSQPSHSPRKWFIDTVSSMDMLVTTDLTYQALELGAAYDKLQYQLGVLGFLPFLQKSVAKSSLPLIAAHVDAPHTLFKALEAGKKKRNVGDAFKHIVTDNWKCDMVVTFNLRSLKNYLTLRNSGAAYFLMRELAIAMQAATPAKYLDLIVKGK